MARGRTGVAFNAVGVDAVVRDFTRKAATVQPLSGAVAVHYAGEAAEDMRSAVSVRSGELRDSITSDDKPTNDGQSVYAEAGPELWRAHFEEYGTTRQAPDPFVGPAADKVIDDFADAIEALSDL